MPTAAIDPNQLAESDDPRALEEIKNLLRADRVLAHAYLFPHRHTDLTPAFHREMILDYYSDHPFIVTEAFRGGAKSTIAEEALCIEALFEELKNAVILGENETRAKDRLIAIRSEIETNEKIINIFGDQVGRIWGDTKIELRNGAYLQALGRDQPMRGVKHHSDRPDRLLVDDYEDEESVQTPEARKKVSDKFFGVVLPAMDKKRRKVRFYGTPLDVAALLCSLKKLQSWLSKRFPIQYTDENGVRHPMWGGRWTLDEIDRLMQDLLDAGKSEIWEREYMLNAVDEKMKPFKRTDIRIENLVHTWEPCYAIYDPARTTKETTSAHTGMVVASWVGRRMPVWESGGHFWKPSEIVADMFRVDETYNPVAICVEVNGLEEFLMQPIRDEQMKRGRLLPIRAIRAPRQINKDDFIKGLQPYTIAGEIVLNGEQLQLLEQFDTFPRGRKDILNALAYLPKVRAGVPVYPTFHHIHVVPELEPAPRTPMFLCVNASYGVTTAVLIQVVHGVLHVLGDWLSDKPAHDVLYNVLGEVGMEFRPEKGFKPRLIAPAHHWNDYNTLGLIAAARAVPAEIFKGGDVQKGRGFIKGLLEKSAGKPGVQVSHRATWVLRAMTEGYAYEIEKGGRTADAPLENIYRTLMEGVEAHMALARLYEGDDTNLRIEHTSDGRAYVSARATPR